MDIRLNHRNMTREQKATFIEALLRLKNNTPSVLRPGHQSRYDDFVQVHKNAMGGVDQFHPMPHRSSLFFPWHRVFLRQFERALQTAANDISITLPFWDWSMNGPNDPFTPNFLGGNGDRAQNDRVVTGPFANQAGRFPVRIWDLDIGDPGLRRVFGTEEGAHLPNIDQVTTALSKTPYAPGPDSWVNFCEGMLHDPVHRWVGGNMSFPTSPNDPVFFLHHCYLDLLWERWKRQHPTLQAYQPEQELDATLVFHASDKTAPWTQTWTVRDVLNSEALDYTYGVFSNGVFSNGPVACPVPPPCPTSPQPAGPVVDLVADDLTI